MLSSQRRIFPAEIVSKQEIAQDTYELELKITKDSFTFKAGQYIWLSIPEGKKAFSICSSPNSNPIKIAFRNTDSDFKKALLRLIPGQEVTLEGPFGYLSLPEENIPVVLVAGGIGITPFLSMIQDSLKQKSSRQIVLLYFNVSEQKAAYLNELSELEKNNKNFHFYKKVGLATWAEMQKETKDLAEPIWYVIGPKEMCQSVGKILLENQIELERIKFEEFYVTAQKQSNVTLVDLEEAEKFRVTVENSSNHIIITDLDGHIQFANKAAEEITGYSTDEMKGQTPRLWGSLMGKSFYENFWKTIKYEQKPMVGEMVNRRKNGEVYFTLTRVSPIIYKGNLVGFIGTEEDISKIKLAQKALEEKTEELEQANKKLRKLDQMKDDFVSLASHELRTPMTAIEGFVDMILEGRYGVVSEELKEPLNYVAESTERLIVLVNDMLNISRIEQDRMTFVSQTVSLKEIVGEVVETFRPLFSKKKLTLGVEDMDHLMVKVDPQKLKQILTNLVGNALKFTDKGSVVISASGGKVAKITVSDTGMGIAQADLPRLFGKFEQISSQQAGKPQGTGLGLYYSKELAQKMGGNLYLEKSEINKGSIFSLTLPLGSV